MASTKKVNQITELKKENKRLRDALETGIICMERNWFEEIPVYVKNYISIAKDALTSNINDI